MHPEGARTAVSIDILDSEVLEIEKILNTLKDRAQHHSGELGNFDNEIKTRFAEIGFAVDVKWWHTNVEGVKMPEVEIIGRTLARHFDHDRMVHEVTNDMLGLGTGGTIKMTEADLAKIRQVEQGHKHGPSCDH